MTNVLVINSGSSSLKYQVVDATTGIAAATGLIERIGLVGGRLIHERGAAGRSGAETTEWQIDAADHTVAVEQMQRAFTELGPDLADMDLAAIGHRVVQGGARFGGPVLVTEEVKQIIDGLADLAPLHNPPNLAGIEAAQRAFPDLDHVVVFDTAFHLSMPARASTYALNAAVARQYRIRRYGFHGTSHSYVARQAAQFLGKRDSDTNVIVLHLGNGASATAVAGGTSIDTSMGLTPLEGLVMGTRTGDIDPAVALYLSRHAGMGIDEIDDLFNRRSGMLGVTGHQDMRDVIEAWEAGNPDAELGLDLYTYRLRKYLGSYLAVLGRVDAVVFTAGIGENSPDIRLRTMSGLDHLGMGIDPARNLERKPGVRDISAESARVRTLVIPTNEEWEIARQTMEVVLAPGEHEPRALP
ncbi:acetate/propionate family kinase [Pseudactinotalea sp. HY158]|uniref:acetate/propionate family kinase n=1 Tax=Pseudactinotalea sp. HY158 TaxID=2654547 RepID=UPI00129D0358|nr:acetate kinase [Pseudactinotalea sp. HY158]QGH70361.1 acetate/propionate family kinase [Pseudactinotalea sp. HY158]